jgi:hypothetical protein
MGAECLLFADAEEEFAKLLKARLEAMPEFDSFDSEGWALDQPLWYWTQSN